MSEEKKGIFVYPAVGDSGQMMMMTGFTEPSQRRLYLHIVQILFGLFIHCPVLEEVGEQCSEGVVEVQDLL